MKLAMCYPDSEWLNQILGGEKADAAYIQQKYITTGLAQRNDLSLIAPHGFHQIMYTTPSGPLKVAPQTWSASKGYVFLYKLIWRFQKQFGVPYLNIFSNSSRYDALLRILPDHDVVYERNSLYNQSAAMASKKLGLPYIMFFDADQLLELEYMGQPITGMLRWRVKEILKYNINAARKIICVSEPAKRHIISAWNVQPEKINVFPNGVDVKLFTPNETRGREARSNLEIGEQEHVFLFVGNFYKWHDVSTLLKAFMSVQKNDPLARLVLVGSGSQMMAMQNLAEELNIMGLVKFVGLRPHNEIPGLINSADVTIVPVPEMDHDLWLSPMKVFEYMASGSAVVASKVGQIAEVIEHERNGLQVSPGKPEELAQAMMRFINEPGLRKQLGSQARQDALEKHSWVKYVSSLTDVFSAVSQKISV